MYNIYIFFPLGHALEYWQLRSLSKDKLFLQKKVQTCPTNNAILAILCQPARIPQLFLLQHCTLNVKQEERMKLLIYLLAKTMLLHNYHFHFFLIFSTFVHMILKFMCFRNTFSHVSTFVFVFKNVFFPRQKYLV